MEVDEYENRDSILCLSDKQYSMLQFKLKDFGS